MNISKTMKDTYQSFEVDDVALIRFKFIIAEVITKAKKGFFSKRRCILQKSLSR